MHELPGTVIPVSLVTGFLGAGKTTLINRWLGELSDTAVIVNEFGSVGVDQLLFETADDGIIEIASGCVCCSLRGDLVEALERLLRAVDNGRRPHLSRVIIETTGLADPGPVLGLLVQHPYLRLRFRLDRVITVVDGLMGGASLDEHDEAVRQAAAADMLILTKQDLAGTGQTALVDRLLRINPSAVLVHSGSPDATAEIVFGGNRHIGKAAEPRFRADEPAGNSHSGAVISIAVVRDAAMDALRLDAFTDRLALEFGRRLIRVKGLVRNAGTGAEGFILHGVQGYYSPPSRLASWPDADRRSRIVFIGRGFEAPAIERLCDAFFDIPSADTPDRQAITENPLAIAGIGRLG